MQGAGGKFVSRLPDAGPANGGTEPGEENLPELVEISDSSEDEDESESDESSWSDAEETDLRSIRARDMSRVPTRAESRAQRAQRRQLANLETQFAGPKEKTGKARGSYTGHSERAERDKRKKLNDARHQYRESPVAPAFTGWIKKRGAGAAPAVRPDGPSVAQASLPDPRAVRGRAPSPEPVPITLDESPPRSVSYRATVEDVEDEYDAMLRMLASDDEDDDMVLPLSTVQPAQSTAHKTGPPSPCQPAPVDIAHANAEAMHVEEEDTSALLDVIDEEQPTTIPDCRALAEAGLRLAKRAKNFDDQLRFAHLSNFYAKVPHLGRMKASALVAKNFARGPHCARCIRSDARYFEAHGQLPPPRRSKRRAGGSLLDDEGVYMGVQRWLRCQEKSQVTPALLRNYVNQTRHPLDVEAWVPPQTLQQRSLDETLEFAPYATSHCVIFLLNTSRRQRVYTGENMEPQPLDLKNGEKEVILLFHDESAYHANDYQRDYWLKAGQQVLKKKEKGRGRRGAPHAPAPEGSTTCDNEGARRHQAQQQGHG